MPNVSQETTTDKVIDIGYTNAVTPERITRLRQWKHFDEIIEFVLRATVLSFWWEPFRESRLNGCCRASFRLRVEPSVYDAFFNASVGYRAQYAVSASQGELANRSLLSALKPMLVRALAGRIDIDKELVSASLDGRQAKIWIEEGEVDAELSDPEASILYEPWERASLDGQGLRAPMGQMLEVKGAWVDESGAEHLDPRKERRSLQISQTGFS